MPAQTTTNAAPMLRFPYGERRKKLVEQLKDRPRKGGGLGSLRRIGGYQPRVAL